MSERSSPSQDYQQDAYHYVGEELDLLARASHWKEYVRHCLMPHIRGSVLEVGAGIGGTTTFLRPTDHRNWRCLEPDPRLAAILEQTLRQHWPRFEPDVLVGSIEALRGEQSFDTILYIDVLEHIEDDRTELARAAALLASRGRLIVLSPAHNYLFSEFDRAIGHFRRYNRKLLKLISPQDLKLRKLFYLDAVGMLLSLGNRLLLRSPRPTFRQLAFWDRCIVPCSRVIDPLALHRLGKTIIAVWEKTS
jgi:2-polyprenyl-3-methyl-5-hydroxy-6-metoxy-1,4-benzoquinol methylase